MSLVVAVLVAAEATTADVAGIGVDDFVSSHLASPVDLTGDCVAPAFECHNSYYTTAGSLIERRMGFTVARTALNY
jgi:hypothetical protein